MYSILSGISIAASLVALCRGAFDLSSGIQQSCPIDGVERFKLSNICIDSQASFSVPDMQLQPPKLDVPTGYYGKCTIETPPKDTVQLILERNEAQPELSRLWGWMDVSRSRIIFCLQDLRLYEETSFKFLRMPLVWRATSSPVPGRKNVNDEEMTGDLSIRLPESTAHSISGDIQIHLRGGDFMHYDDHSLYGHYSADLEPGEETRDLEEIKEVWDWLGSDATKYTHPGRPMKTMRELKYDD